MKLLTLIMIACFLNTPVQAKKLYKYKDSQGLWHFSDTVPKTQQVVEVRQLKSAQKRYLWLEKKGPKQSPEYFVINNHKAPIEIEFSLHKSNNAISTPALPKRFIIPSGQSETLFQITGLNRYKSWHYSLKYRYVIGSSLAHHNTNAVYTNFIFDLQ